MERSSWVKGGFGPERSSLTIANQEAVLLPLVGRVVAIVKDGNIQVWEEASGQSETIYDAGDVISVTLIRDGLELPLLASLGFVEVLIAMWALVWLARRYARKHPAS